MGASPDFLGDMIVESVPPKVRTTMTEEQIVAVRAAASKKRHQIDLRWTQPLPFCRWYFVVLVGKDTRTEIMAVGEERRSAAVSSMKWWLAALWSVIAFALLATVAYVFKSKLGIDLFSWHLKDVL